MAAEISCNHPERFERLTQCALCSLGGLARLLALLQGVHAHGGGLVAGDVDDSAHHVQHAVDARNQCNALNGMEDSTAVMTMTHCWPRVRSMPNTWAMKMAQTPW